MNRMNFLKAKIATAAIILIALLCPFAYAAENAFIKTSDGTKGVVLASKATGVSAEVVLVDTKGKEMGKPSAKLSPDGSFIEVAQGGGIELRCKGRFAIIPGFHLDDTLFDPTVCILKELYVPAENFMMIVPEGGKSAFVIAWPAGGNQLPMLLVEGTGKDARFGATRVIAGGKPVFIGVLDNVLYVDDLDRKLDYSLELKGYRWSEIKTGQKIPFTAVWWMLLVKPQGKEFTMKFPNPALGNRVPPYWTYPATKPLAGLPVIMYRMGGSAGGTNFLKETDSTYLMGRVHSVGCWVDDEWVIYPEERFAPYYSAIAYPKTRDSNNKTPNDKLTLTDILFETLGKKEVLDLIGYSGFAGRGNGIPKGEPAVNFTCEATYSLLGALQAKKKDEFENINQGCHNLCTALKTRIDEFRDAAKKIVELCGKNAALKNVADQVIPAAKKSEEEWKKDVVEYRSEYAKKFAQQYPDLLSAADAEKVNLDAEWFKRIRDYYAKLYNDWAEKDGAKAKKLATRDHWVSVGHGFKIILQTQRKMLKRICQEATLAGAESPEARKLALEIRALVQQTMFKPHMQEDQIDNKTFYFINEKGRK